MHAYQGIRISYYGIPTYGDKYVRVRTDKELKYNDIISVGDMRVLILFKEI